MRLTKTQIAHVRSLEDRHGRLSASRVVADAKKPSSPLHGLKGWSWDLHEAAEKHWLHFAREVIGAVTVEVTRRNVTVLAPCYVNLPGAEGRGYQRVDAVRDDPAQARISLIYTLEVSAGHLRRAYDLAEPLGLGRQIDALLRQVVGVQRVAREKTSA